MFIRELMKCLKILKGKIMCLRKRQVAMNAYLGKFKEREMKTTVKHVGSVREWEGPIENWEAHVDEIKHWCDGGDVQFNNPPAGWFDANPNFDLHIEYRIKQREPKPGEVWITPAGMILIMDEYCAAINPMGHCYCGNDVRDSNPIYAAPSVEAYYARKMLKKAEEFGDVLDGHYRDTIISAAQLEK